MRYFTQFCSSLALLLFSGLALAAPAIDPTGHTLDAHINTLFTASTSWYVELIFSNIPGTNLPWIVLWLIGAAIFLTFYFKFIQFRAVRHAIALVKGHYSDPKHHGEVNHFQALVTALSGTVGLGNIAGVAVAISIGGAGATFWMILAGLLGMALKFTECTLAVKYRNEYANGTTSGGPMYYITKGFKDRRLPGGKVLAVLFAIACIGGSLGAGNMFQSNQAHAQLVNISGGVNSLFYDNGWITGLVLALVVFAVIAGGIKSIAKITEKVVPFMALLYIGAALAVIAINYEHIGAAFHQIWEGAFTGLGVTGGVTGALIQGFRRATFSNEAGVGSSAIAHSAVRTKEPVTEGVVALLEPFIDTVVICTMTALVIIISGVLQIDQTTGLYLLNEAGHIATANGSSGVELTSAAFAQGLSWFPYVLACVVFLFAFSTILSWSYYGLKAWTYLVGEGPKRELLFKTIFCSLTVVGASAQLGSVIDFSDAMIFSMAVVNITALYLLLPIVKREADSYFSRLKTGEISKYADLKTAIEPVT